MNNSAENANKNSEHGQLTEEEKTMYEQAASLSKEGNVISAIPILEKLVDNRPDSAKFLTVLAGAYWEDGRIDEAANKFRLAISLQPKWEAPSLGLFHCLWEQGRQEEALNEVKRFMTLSYSDEYVGIVKAINASADASNEPKGP